MAQVGQRGGLYSGSPLRRCSSALVIALLTCGSVIVAAQDRVIVFELAGGAYGSRSMPPLIRDFEVSEGGRRWSLIRTVVLPTLNVPYISLWSPVALPDGTRVLWLDHDGTSSVLQQYDATTGAISTIAVGPFDREAFLVGDPFVTRVFVVERTTITIVNARGRPYSVTLSGPKRIVAAYAASGYLVVQRRGESSNPTPDDEALVIKSDNADIVRVVSLGIQSTVCVSHDATRLYRAYTYSLFSPTGRFLGIESRLELWSLVTGEMLARVLAPSPSWIFQIDDSGRFLIQDRTNGQNAGTDVVIVRDATTLAAVGQLDPQLGITTRDVRLRQTSRERAILVLSRPFESTAFDPCPPTIRVFDGTTLTLVNRMVLHGRCRAAIVPLPSR